MREWPLTFTDRSPTVNLNQLAALPSGYHMQRINKEIVLVLEEFDYYVTMFGSVERAIQNMIGYCLMRGDTVVCEAIAGPLTRGVPNWASKPERPIGKWAWRQ